MKNKLRIVFDTNVCASAALLQKSVARRALSAALKRGAVLFSIETFDELVEVLNRPKLQKHLNVDQRDEFICEFVSIHSEVPITVQINDGPDAKHNKFLELAVSGKATRIVTEDADLLELHPYRGIKIMKPAEMLFELQRH